MKSFSAFLAVIIAVTALSTNVCAQPESLDVSAKCAVVMNADTGKMLFGKNAFEKRAIASTTKIMTALLTLEAGDLDRQFMVDSMAIKVEGTSMGLKEGDIVTRRALCVGMLLPSGNDAANAAAVSVAGSMTAFAELMNKRAAKIGMTDTHFVNPSGLDAKEHYSTAYDMALLAAEALKNPEFREICAMKTAKVQFGAPPYTRTLYNSNKLLKMYEGCIGIKPGFTDDARRCLVSAAERNGCTVIAVTLNAPNDWEDHRKLLDKGFELLDPYRIGLDCFSAEVVGGEYTNVTAIPKEKVTLGLDSEEARTISVKYRTPAFVYADVRKGDVLGSADIYAGGKLVRRVDMTASETILRQNKKRGAYGWLIELFTGGAVKINI